MKYLRLASAIALFTLPIALAFACTSHPSTTECTPCLSPRDCETGLDCAGGVCQRPCTADSQCMTAFGCGPLEVGDTKRYCACTANMADEDAGD